MKSVATIAALSLVCAVSVDAAPILAVDAGLTNAPVQSGFVGFEVANPAGASSVARTYSGLAGVTSGQIAVTVYGTGTLGGRDRGAFSGAPAAFTYYSLYRDLLTQLIEGTTDSTVTVQLSGLDPSTPYILQIWSNDRNFNGNAAYTWHDTTTGSAVLLGTIVNQVAANAVYPDNNAYSLMATVTSDASGLIKLAHNDPAGTGTFNGLTISAVPEPGTLGALAIAGAALLIRRRR